MNIVIIGSGKIGDSICEQLAREGHDVTLIDKTSDISARRQISLI